MVAERIGHSLEREGLITHDIENAYLAFDPQNALSRRHHPPDLGACGFHRRLAALAPKPGAHLTRYHGVFAPGSALRARIVWIFYPPAANRRGRLGSPGSPGCAAADFAICRTSSLERSLIRAFEITIRKATRRLRAFASRDREQLRARMRFAPHTPHD
jgi:hypothetical protein